MGCVFSKQIKKPQALYRKEIHMQEDSLLLVKDHADPDHYLLQFTLDATVPGSISIFHFDKEGREDRLVPVSKDSKTPIKTPIGRGLQQSFQQPSGTGINLSMYDSKVIRLAIKAEAEPSLGSDISYELIKAVIKKKRSGDISLTTEEKLFRAHGKRHNCARVYKSGCNLVTDDDGCVICMAMPSGVIPIPCKHECLCYACAGTFQKFEHQPCPICGEPYQRLVYMDGGRIFKELGHGQSQKL